MELKKKYRSVVYKRRISLPLERALACVAGTAPWPDSQIAAELAYAASIYRPLRPTVFLSYERDSLHGTGDDGLRVTFDRDIRYRTDGLTLDSDTQGNPLLDSDLVLMELKAPGAIPVWMARTLSENGIFRASFSKYGTAYRQILQHERKGYAYHA